MIRLNTDNRLFANLSINNIPLIISVIDKVFSQLICNFLKKKAKFLGK